MSFIRWFGEEDSLSQVERLRKEMDRWMSAFVPNVNRAFQPGVYPPINVYDDGESFIVRAEVPGVSAADIDVSVVKNTLTIKGKRDIEAADANASYHRRERNSGEFRRAFTLPEAVDGSKTIATTKDGVLEILLPRAEESKLRRIEVKSN